MISRYFREIPLIGSVKLEINLNKNIQLVQNETF